MAAVHILSKTSGGLGPGFVQVYLRDKLAHFHLDDAILKLDFQKLGISWTFLTGLTGMWGEDPQHSHVAAHYHFVCKVMVTEEENKDVKIQDPSY